MGVKQALMPADVQADLAQVAQIAAQAKRTFELAQAHIRATAAQIVGASGAEHISAWSYDPQRGIFTWSEPAAGAAAAEETP